MPAETLAAAAPQIAAETAGSTWLAGAFAIAAFDVLLFGGLHYTTWGNQIGAWVGGALTSIFSDPATVAGAGFTATSGMLTYTPQGMN